MSKEKKLFKEPKEKGVTVHPHIMHGRYFEGITDELPGREAEGKLSVQGVSDPPKVVEYLMSQIACGTDETLEVDRVLSTESEVKKFSYQGQSFSIISRDDGTTFIKVKRDKEKWGDGIIVSNEDKILIDSEDDLPDLLAPGVDPEAIVYLGTVLRRKDATLIKGDEERVYQIVVDTTSASSRPDTLQQAEIEYKGKKGEPTPQMKYPAALIPEIVGEIESVREQVRGYLDEQGIPSHPTDLTKTQWLRGVQKQKD